MLYRKHNIYLDSEGGQPRLMHFMEQHRRSLHSESLHEGWIR